MDIPITDLHNLCTQLGIRCITDREYQFIKEYCVILKPLAMALDFLQGEENCFYGTILPTLEALMAKTLDLKDSFSRMTSGLPDVIVEVKLFVRLFFVFAHFLPSFTKILLRFTLHVLN